MVAVTATPTRWKPKFTPTKLSARLSAMWSSGAGYPFGCLTLDGEGRPGQHQGHEPNEHHSRCHCHDARPRPLGSPEPRLTSALTPRRFRPLMSDFKIADPKLADAGRLRIEWAESRMPVLMALREKGKKDQAAARA